MQRVTIADLATRLGLSKSSVSYALNGRPGVSEETRRRVLELAEELDWHPSSTARALASRRSGTVGLVVRRDPEMLSTEPFFVRVLAGMEGELERADGALLLRITDDPERERRIYERWWRSGRVDGFICLDQHVDDPRPALLAALGAPVVFIGIAPADRAPTDPAQPRVVSRDDDDAETLVAHLADLGHRHVGHVGGPSELTHERLRCSTVAAAAARHGVRLTHVGADYSKEGGQRAVGELLDGPDAPTAVITGNDLMAIGAVHAARARQLAIPAGLAIASWDDSFLCQIVEPQVTALDRAPADMGALAAAMVLDRIAAASGGAGSRRPCTRRASPSVLVPRTSTIG